MIRQCMVFLLIGALLALCSPVYAGDFVSPRFNTPAKSSSVGSALPTFGAKVGLPSSYAAFGLPQSSQQQSSQPTPPPRQRHWSTKGKVLTILGIALAGAGGYMMTKDNETISSSCSGNTCTELQVRWKVAGGISIGTGAALAIIGLTRHSD
jgi:hypothetical protein